ncbi:uncharacterized protein ATNIH1004_000163 [Aspergillus tanneri]|uniref:Uncharacterized protein n=1 Tax=Aspergillus tanneri TaxID=1220188 RepID=A0A5M9MVX4_9EURO|nr:uncharacterized protein ATNIH1004_000163 [Aspergillus tanneri]KAA8651282.1 hypothetical protein ATNIH1004_000163 [Aspergillus tanneri]
MSQYQAYNPQGPDRRCTYQAPRLYAASTNIAPQSNSSFPCPLPPTYRHSNSFSAYPNGSIHGPPSINMRDRSSIHQFLPASLLPGGEITPSSHQSSPSLSISGPIDELVPQTHERSNSSSSHPMQLQPGGSGAPPSHEAASSRTSQELHLHTGTTSLSSQHSPSSVTGGSPSPVQHPSSLHPRGESISSSRQHSPSPSFSSAYPAPLQIRHPSTSSYQHSPAPSFSGDYPPSQGPPSNLSQQQSEERLLQETLEGAAIADGSGIRFYAAPAHTAQAPVEDTTTVHGPNGRSYTAASATPSPVDTTPEQEPIGDSTSMEGPNARSYTARPAAADTHPHAMENTTTVDGPNAKIYNALPPPTTEIHSVQAPLNDSIAVNNHHALSPQTDTYPAQAPIENPTTVHDLNIRFYNALPPPTIETNNQKQMEGPRTVRGPNTRIYHALPPPEIHPTHMPTDNGTAAQDSNARYFSAASDGYPPPIYTTLPNSNTRYYSTAPKEYHYPVPDTSLDPNTRFYDTPDAYPPPPRSTKPTQLALTQKIKK